MAVTVEESDSKKANAEAHFYEKINRILQTCRIRQFKVNPTLVIIKLTKQSKICIKYHKTIYPMRKFLAKWCENRPIRRVELLEFSQ